MGLIFAGFFKLLFLFHFCHGQPNVIPRTFSEVFTSIYYRALFNQNIQKNYSKGFYNYLVNDLNPVNGIENLMSSIDTRDNIDALLPNLTESCSAQILAFSKAFSKKELWSLRVIDSFGKPPSAILQGGLIWPGEYTQCVKTVVPSVGFHGKYCGIKAPVVTAPGSLFIAICMPQQCNVDDITQIVNLAIEKKQINSKNVTIMPTSLINSSRIQCQEHVPLDAAAILAIVVLSIFGFIVLLATIYDTCQQYVFKCKSNEAKLNKAEFYDKHEPKLLKLLKCFSFYTNAKKVFTISKNSNDQLQCINGVRVMSLSSIIIAHSYLFGMGLKSDMVVENDWVKRLMRSLSVYGFFNVDSFFVLSGLLTSYIFLKEINKPKNGLSVGFMVKYYVHRYLRLTPVYAFVLMIGATLTGYLGDGPFYPKGTGFEQNKCRDTWWTNLLYINNLVNEDKMCYGITWYMALDMQFHWIAPIILIPMALRKNQLAFIISGLVLLMSSLSIGIILIAYPGAELGGFGQRAIIFRKLIYHAPWARIGPYIVGIILGNLIYAYKTKAMSRHGLTRTGNLILWILSLILITFNAYGIHPDFGVKYVKSRTLHIIYHCCSKTIWATGVCFMVYSCVTGNGGIINKILSWTIWTPLARLSYTAYLVHLIIITHYYASMEQPFINGNVFMLYIQISHLILSFFVSFLVSTFFEAPFLALEKFIFK